MPYGHSQWLSVAAIVNHRYILQSIPMVNLFFKGVRYAMPILDMHTAIEGSAWQKRRSRLNLRYVKKSVE